MSAQSSAADRALALAIEAALADPRVASLAGPVDRLMGAYRSGDRPSAPTLADDAMAAAYAAYRMPATAGAVSAALRQVRQVVPGWAPANHLDLGAGTGAAAWAVAGELPTVGRMTLLEQSAPAIALGRDILASGGGVLPAAQWQQWELPDADRPLPDAGLVTVAYVLGELDDGQQRRVVSMAAGAAGTVVLVEPGTPAGYRRILAARDRLLALGLVILAPCPHELACPLAGSRRDWCHFAARVDRSVLHRRLKAAELPYEDEKFCFVAASRARDGEGDVVEQPEGRVIRRPQRRKGLVTLRLCARSGEAEDRPVSRRQGPVYRAATDVEWGDAWSSGDVPQID